MTPFYCLRVTDKYGSGNGLEISYYTFKPLTPRRGQLLISPYNISSLAPQEMYREQYGEYSY